MSYKIKLSILLKADCVYYYNVTVIYSTLSIGIKVLISQPNATHFVTFTVGQPNYTSDVIDYMQPKTGSAITETFTNILSSCKCSFIYKNLELGNNCFIIYTHAKYLLEVISGHVPGRWHI